MTDYKVTDTELTSIANAIRAKTGKSAQIEFPTEFVSEIGSISGGGTVNIMSGSETPTGSVGEDGQIYLHYIDIAKLSDWGTSVQSSMSVISKTDEGIEFKYANGDNIGAMAYQLVDLTYINTIEWSITSGAHSYNSYATARFAPFIYLDNNINYASDSDGLSGIGAASRINADNTTNSGSYDVSNLTGNYYLCFNSTGCDSKLNYIKCNLGGKIIDSTFLKVDGVWRDLIGCDVNDVNTGDGTLNE